MTDAATPSQWAEAKADVEQMLGDDFVYVMETLEAMGDIIAGWNVAQGFWASENKGEKYALMHSELSEGFEGVRKPGLSGKIGDQGFTIEEEELADAVIRILDYSGYFNIRLGLALRAKLRYNLSRPYMHGKTC